MTLNTGTGFTQISTDSGTAIISPSVPNLSIVGAGATNTSASGSTITVTSTGTGAGIIQQVRTSTTTYSTLTTVIPFDDTIPQVSEGTQLFSLAITPVSATSVLILEASVMCGMDDSSAFGTFSIHQDGGTDAIYATTKRYTDPTDITNFAFSYYMTSGTTSSTTFTLRAGPTNPRNLFINGNNSGRKFGGVSLSSFYVTEIVI